MASVPTGTPNPNNLTLTINTPTGVVAGDVIIANIQLRGGSSPFPYPNPTPAAGWIEIARKDFENTGTHHRCILWYKIAGSSEPSSYTFDLGTGIPGATGAIVAFSGVDTSGPTPFDIPPGSYTAPLTNSQISNVTAITTNTANAAVLMFSDTVESKTIYSFSTTTHQAL